MRKFALLIILALMLSACSNVSADTAVPPAGLHIVGTHLEDAHGQRVFLIGAARSSLEYDCAGDGHYARSDFRSMRGWGMNTVRFPLSAAYWLNIGQICPGYQQTVRDAVAAAEAEGFYVILTLQFTAPLGPLPSPAGASYPLPDQTQSLAFWRSAGQVFANDPNVLFELYSEPHDVSWQQWLNGGSVTSLADADHAAGTYQGAGMQQLANVVHQVAPNRIAIISGNTWGGDLTGVPSQAQVKGTNLMYGVHLYPGPDSTDPTTWPERFGNLANSVPVMATEFGQLDCQDTFIKAAMPYLTFHTNGMVAWTWNLGDCSRPALLAAWDGSFTTYGQTIHDFFLALDVPLRPRQP